MKRAMMLLGAGVLVSGFAPTAAQSHGAAVDPVSWVGERLEYDAKFGILNLGRAEMSVVGIDTVRQQEALHIRFLIEGGNFLYRLHNVWDSWVAPGEFASLRFLQDHDEGGRRYRNAYEIFPDSGTYRQNGADSLLPTSVLPLDDAAFFYFVRTTPLEPGERYEYNRYFKPDRNPVVLEVIGRDTIDVPAGRFATLVVKPIIKGGGIFKEGAEGRMWISDDDRRIIVQIKSKFYFGSLTFRLIKFETAPAAEAEP
ncbi:MAG TPA: DUF3108 domain-containing protein [Gemmatimonadales bacterium]